MSKLNRIEIIGFFKMLNLMMSGSFQKYVETRIRLINEGKLGS